MYRWIPGVLFVAVSLIAVQPREALAQRSGAHVSVQVLWEWGSDRWRPHRPVRTGAVYAPAREAIRIPPGHLPPPGSCRLWYPGVPPGHQPPPQRCDRLFRVAPPPGAVLVGAPAHYERFERRGPPGHRKARGAKGGRGRGGPR